jgi:hypothetical protein
MRTLLALLPSLLLGCAPETEISWLRGFGYGWTGFNHRVSYLHWELANDGLDMAIIGGASSTAYVPPLPEGCDEELCSELPFEDTSTVDFSWARATTRQAVGVAEATVVANPGGAQTQLEIPLSTRGKGEAAVMLQALVVDTDHELAGGPDCFIPMLGWHPRRLALALVDPQLSPDGHSVTVTLEGHFESGLSFEEYRACQDEVIDEAQVPITARVLAIASSEGERHTISHGQYYPFSGNQFSPEEQPDPDSSERPLSLGWDQAIAGWSALDFRFHQDDTELRGAYLRTLSVHLDEEQGWASGHATNYSPGTQLSDFEYHFEGEVTALPADGEIERGSARFEQLEAELDDDARPVVHHQGWK